MSSLKSKMAKCNNCYVSATEKPLNKCARCKAAKYCSKECQKADWKNHKQNCLNNAALAEALQKHDSTPLGAIERLLMPDGISFYELDQRLEQWVRFHNPTMLGATLHALRLPLDLGRTRTHVMHVRLSPRFDHGGMVAKYFRVVDASAVEVAQAREWPEPWPASLTAFAQMQDESERLRRGHMAAAMVECPPLAVQTVPFGSIKNLKNLAILENWKEVLIQDVQDGKKFGRPVAR